MMTVRKRKNQIFAGVLFFLLALVLAAGMPAAPSGSMSLTVEAKDKSDGWHGNKYYKDGQYLTGMQKIDGRYYYFGRKGNKKTSCWKTDERGRRFYFNKKGVRVTGIKKISGEYYYFKSNGAQLTSDKTYGNYTYFIDCDGHLEGYLKKTKTGKTRYYKPDGTKMTATEGRVFQTTREAETIVAQITNAYDSQAVKLEKCFRWVMSHPYVAHSYSNSTWYCSYAEDHFLRHEGDCRADACAFAFLAKAIGYKEVYVCGDWYNTPEHIGHYWCEIAGRVYDPLFAQSKSFSKYYGGTYTPGSSAGADLWRYFGLQIS